MKALMILGAFALVGCTSQVFKEPVVSAKIPADRQVASVNISDELEVQAACQYQIYDNEANSVMRMNPVLLSNKGNNAHMFDPIITAWDKAGAFILGLYEKNKLINNDKEVVGVVYQLRLDRVEDMMDVIYKKDERKPIGKNAKVAESVEFTIKNGTIEIFTRDDERNLIDHGDKFPRDLRLGYKIRRPITMGGKQNYDFACSFAVLKDGIAL